MFETADAKNRVYRKKITAGCQHPPSISVKRRGAIGASSAQRLLSRGDVQQAAERLVLNRYGPPGVLVDDQLNIIQFRGKIKEYLEPTQGEASLNLARMLPFGLVHGIKEAIAAAQLSVAPVLREHLRLGEGSASMSSTSRSASSASRAPPRSASWYCSWRGSGGGFGPGDRT